MNNRKKPNMYYKSIFDIDYKSFDRHIKNSGSVTIKPGKTKYVRFYVRGSVTWYKYNDFTLYSKVKYDGTTYQWHTWDDDSVYKRNNKWYATYWNRNEYEAWGWDY